jgi:hypothetical protein
VFNSDGSVYGNNGLTNTGRTFSGEVPITLSDSSVAIFRKRRQNLFLRP